jgi:hypothetical protein
VLHATTVTEVRLCLADLDAQSRRKISKSFTNKIERYICGREHQRAIVGTESAVSEFARWL